MPDKDGGNATHRCVESVRLFISLEPRPAQTESDPIQPRYKDYWGYEIKMMEELIRRLDFTYDIVNPPDAAWGMINKTGQWTGLTGMASRGDADSGASTGIEVIGIIGDFLPNFARFQVGENVQV